MIKVFIPTTYYVLTRLNPMTLHCRMLNCIEWLLVMKLS